MQQILLPTCHWRASVFCLLWRDDVGGQWMTYCWPLGRIVQTSQCINVKIHACCLKDSGYHGTYYDATVRQILAYAIMIWEANYFSVCQAWWITFERWLCHNRTPQPVAILQLFVVWLPEEKRWDCYLLFQWLQRRWTADECRYTHSSFPRPHIQKGWNLHSLT